MALIVNIGVLAIIADLLPIRIFGRIFGFLLSLYTETKEKLGVKIKRRINVTETETKEKLGVKIKGRINVTETETEEKLLANEIKRIRYYGFLLHGAMLRSNLGEAVKYSRLLLWGLEYRRLSWHNYYLLYTCALDELSGLDMFFESKNRHGCSFVHISEIVRHQRRLLPRLYLMCTVAKSLHADKIFLKDLLNMCCAVQNPMHGLVLRSYLAQVLDIHSNSESEGYNIMDAVELVLQNITEMIKLWVRLQHQEHFSEKKKLLNDPRDFVVGYLRALSQMKGFCLEIYRDIVLPTVLKPIINCKDGRAQYYLMNYIIQIFPIRYHLHTIEILLGACHQLQPAVDLKTLLSKLMDRLSNFAYSNSELLPIFLQVEVFSKLRNGIKKVIEAQVNMPIVRVIDLYMSLLNFTLHVHPDRLDYVDQLLGACVKTLSEKPNLEDNVATITILRHLKKVCERFLVRVPPSGSRACGFSQSSLSCVHRHGILYGTLPCCKKATLTSYQHTSS